MSNKNRIVFYIFAGVGALIVAAWLLTYPLPVRREMMLDSTLSFLLTIVLTGLLWWTSRQSTNARTFWTLLASGWTLNLVGNAAWGASRMVTGKSVPLFGWIDAIYIARYILVFAAFWRCLDRLGRRWVDLVVVIAIAIVVAWLGVFWPKMTSPDVELSHILDFLSGAIYPIVDAALIYLAILAWARAAERPKRPLGLLALAMTCYGAANWINWSARLISLETMSDLATLLWLPTDVLTGSSALYTLWRDVPPSSTETT